MLTERQKKRDCITSSLRGTLTKIPHIKNNHLSKLLL